MSGPLVAEGGLASAIAYLRDTPPAAAYAFVFVAGFGEYVFPPLPGDTFVVAAAALAGAFGWNVPLTLAVVVLSNVAGAAATYEIGARLRTSGRLDTLSPERAATLHRVRDLVDRYGLIVIAANRFFPGIRSGFFVAAGIAGLSRPKVLALAAVGGAVWNGLLVGLGAWAGQNLAWFEGVVSRVGYGLAALSITMVVAVGLALRRRS